MIPQIFKYLLLLASVFICKTCGSQTDQVISDQDVWMPMLRGLPIGRDGEIVAEFEVKKGLKIFTRRLGKIRLFLCNIQYLCKSGSVRLSDKEIIKYFLFCS